MKTIAYIPARSGSKGIPDKNIYPINGIPLIGYTIISALESKIFDYIMVSTDSEKIADIAINHGANVPFLRYENVSNDNTTTIQTVMSDKVRLKKLGMRFDIFVLLQPTSPLRNSIDIINAIKIFNKYNKSVASVSEYDINPFLVRTIDNDRLNKLINQDSSIRRQDLTNYYKVNGAIYINHWNELTYDLSFNDNIYGYIMPQDRSIDVNTIDDIKKIQEIIKQNGKTNNK